MSVLVDTSVWIEHFRNGNDALVNSLVFKFIASRFFNAISVLAKPAA